MTTLDPGGVLARVLFKALAEHAADTTGKINVADTFVAIAVLLEILLDPDTIPDLSPEERRRIVDTFCQTIRKQVAAQ